jgi:hypothetical protein
MSENVMWIEDRLDQRTDQRRAGHKDTKGRTDSAQFMNTNDPAQAILFILQAAKLHNERSKHAV